MPRDVLKVRRSISWSKCPYSLSCSLSFKGTVESTDGTFQSDRESRCLCEIIGRLTFAFQSVRVDESSTLDG